MSIYDGYYERRSGMRPGFRPLFGRVFGALLTDDEIRRRELALPLYKAELGAQAVREGLEKGDSGLRRFGAAMVTSAFIEVADPTGTVVPPSVLSGVNGFAASLQPEDVADNPYISENDASKVSMILGETRKL
jgi:hypothetical protein